MEEIKLNAHAKLNLSLEVVGRRSDGYHNILSLMQGIGLNDIITVKKCPQNGTKYNLPHCTINGHDVYLCTDEKTIPTDLNNLALKGIAHVISQRDTILPGCDLIVDIEKRLPVAAGIAGGSGNAAAAMLGLNALADYPLTLRELMSIGAGVGADVPFSVFMNAAFNKESLSGLRGIEEAGCSARVEGIGERVTPCKPLPLYVIMANPGTGVSTAEAYKAIDEIGYEEKSGSGTMKLFVNDLEKYTLDSYPEAAGLKRRMQEILNADEILMSGSGPTIAAYYKSEKTAKEDFALLAAELSPENGQRLWLTSTGMCEK